MTDNEDRLRELYLRAIPFKKLRRRIIRGYFEIHEIHDELIDFEIEHEVHAGMVRKPSRDFHITKVSPSRYSFPRWNREKEDLREIISELETFFEDTVRRQIIFTKLKNSISQLGENVGFEYRPFLRVLNMCLDALRNIRAEELKKKHVKSLKFIIENLDENMDDFLATELEGVLIDSGLEPTPAIEGIAELYE